MTKCYAFLVTAINKKMQRLAVEGYSIETGYANGYVAVSPEHPLYGESYDDVDIEVHGGLTLAEDTRFLYDNPNITPADIEFLDGKVPEDYWIFGFDTCHAFDDLESWPRERVIEETMKLKTALENWEE